jgi:hypothetical protein
MFQMRNETESGKASAEEFKISKLGILTMAKENVRVGLAEFQGLLTSSRLRYSSKDQPIDPGLHVA